MKNTNDWRIAQQITNVTLGKFLPSFIIYMYIYLLLCRDDEDGAGGGRRDCVAS